jgi:hypothetical protein
MLTPRSRLALAALMFFSMLIALSRTFSSSSFTRALAKTQQERLIEDKIPKHVPIKIKFKAEKEKEFKDLGNKEWQSNFAVEVTNTSDKPIYYLDIWLTYPEIKSENNRTIGVPLRYGRMDFVDFDIRPIPTDVPLKPGETFIFTIPEQDQIGWRAHKRIFKAPDPVRFELSLTQLSFGDGTGFIGSDAKPYPYKRDQSASNADFNQPHATGDSSC